jgi:hypothetical protein
MGSTSHKSATERTFPVSLNQRRRFALAYFFNGSVALFRGLFSHLTVPEPASAHLSPGGEQTDGIFNDYGRGPMEISRLGQRDTTLARPQAHVDSTQAGRTMAEGRIPSGTKALTSTDLRRGGGPQHRPYNEAHKSVGD